MIKKLTHEQIQARQLEKLSHSKVPLVLVLDNIRSLFNVGSMFRCADAAGIEKMLLCGITGYPPQGGITKISLGAEESVPWEYHRTTVDAVRTLKEQGYHVLALEQAQESIAYYEYVPFVDRRIAIIVGNEVEGVSDVVMKMADGAIEIPMAGVKNSLNVSVACGIVVIHIAAQLRQLKI